MRFLSLKEMMLEKGDFEAKNAQRNYWLGLIFLFLLVAGVLIGICGEKPGKTKINGHWVSHGYRLNFSELGEMAVGEWILIGFVGLLLSLIPIILISLLRKARKPENWVIRTKGLRMWIKYRYFANRHFPESETQIIELEKDEILWIRQADASKTYTTSVPSGGSGTGKSFEKYLDIAVDSPMAGQIPKLLDAEINHPPYGVGSAKSKTSAAPVTWAEPNVIRIAWKSPMFCLTPSLKEAMRFFSSWTRIESTVKERADFTEQSLKLLGRDEQIARLKELHQNNPLEAVRSAKNLLKISTTEAMKLFER